MYKMIALAQDAMPKEYKAALRAKDFLYLRTELLRCMEDGLNIPAYMDLASLFMLGMESQTLEGYRLAAPIAEFYSELDGEGHRHFARQFVSVVLRLSHGDLMNVEGVDKPLYGVVLSVWVGLVEDAAYSMELVEDMVFLMSRPDRDSWYLSMRLHLLHPDEAYWSIAAEHCYSFVKENGGDDYVVLLMAELFHKGALLHPALMTIVDTLLKKDCFQSVANLIREIGSALDLSPEARGWIQGAEALVQQYDRENQGGQDVPGRDLESMRPLKRSRLENRRDSRRGDDAG